MAASVLVIDTSEDLRIQLKQFLAGQGHSVRTASSGEEGLTLCQQQMPSLVLLDLLLPGIDGLETMRRIKRMDPACRVVMITVYDTARSVVQAMKLGAEDYITKPLGLEELNAVVSMLVGDPVKVDLHRGKGLNEIVGQSELMSRVLETVRRISGTRSTVLITGESGTGKELVARAIHLNSGRANRPFLSINCASIPASLLEAEFFGYERGAFTDAKSQKLGLIEVAGAGTLLMDEIGMMPLDLQAKILTALETRKFRRLGGTEELSADVRFVAATNANLEKAMENREFRQDLYYRLNVIPIHLPPLRERGEDVLLLARHFLIEYCQSHGMPRRKLTAEAEKALMAHRWPGNVRELKNVLERTVLLTDGHTVTASDLAIRRTGLESPHPVIVPPTGLIQISFPSWGIPLEDLERQVIEAALDHTGGNISHSARLLHISRDTLRYRIVKHRIQAPPPRESEDKH